MSKILAVGSLWQFQNNALPSLFEDEYEGEWITNIRNTDIVLLLGPGEDTYGGLTYKVIVFPTMKIGGICGGWFSKENIDMNVVKRLA